MREALSIHQLKLVADEEPANKPANRSRIMRRNPEVILARVGVRIFRVASPFANVVVLPIEGRARNVAQNASSG